MKSNNYTEMSMDEYREIENRIDSITSEEELIEIHKKLIGKSSKCDYYEIKDCGVKFIRKFLSRDWGRTIVYHYTQGAEKFIQSKYLSDYFKNSIRELLSDEDLSEEVLNALNCDKLINDISEDEILLISSALKDFYENSPRTENVSAANCLMSLLYKLNGSGVMSFIKNNVNDIELARHILITSGLSDRASYYAGRGVNYGDLNEDNLVAIFDKLLKIDQDYAMNFVDMVSKMKTLGATEFINSFMNFAYNGFKSDALNIEDSNVSLDGTYGADRDTVAFASILSAMSRGNDQSYQISASRRMKNSFMSKVEPILPSIKPEYDESENQSFDSGNYIRRR